MRALRRDRDFALFWGGQAVSLTGSAVTRLALPLVAVLTLEASPLELGIVEASVWLPFLGLPLLAGVYVDRHPKRPLLITANATRAVLLGMVPLLWAIDALSVPVLCAIAFTAGVFEVLFQIAELAYVPALVGRNRLLAANSAVESARFGAELSGPGIAGVLVQALGAPLAILADALSYLVSAASLAAIRKVESRPDPGPQPHLRREMAEGLRYMWRSRFIRILAIELFVVNLAWQAFLVSFVLYAIRDRELPAGWWGLVIAAGGATALLSALLAPRLAGRIGYGPALVAAGVMTNLPMLLVPAATGPMWMLVVTWALAMALTGLGGGVINVVSMTVRARLTPDHLLGRVGASTRQLVFAGIPLGAVAGGALAAVIGARPTLWAAAAVGVGSTILLAPLWSLRDLPEQPEATPAPAGSLSA